MFLKSTRIVLINTFSLLSPPTNTWSQFRERCIQCFQLSVCLCVLCSDHNDTKCSKLLRASLRGTPGYIIKPHNCINIATASILFHGKLILRIAKQAVRRHSQLTYTRSLKPQSHRIVRFLDRLIGCDWTSATDRHCLLGYPGAVA